MPAPEELDDPAQPPGSSTSAWTPLTAGQEHLLQSRAYFAQQNVALSPSTITSALRLKGELDYRLLERAIHQVVHRHPALRTAFHEAAVTVPAERARELERFSRSGVFTPGLYRQSIVPQIEFQMPVADLTATPDAVQAAVAEETARGFDHQAPPLLRAKLFRVAPKEQLLVLTVDHLAADAWSMRIVRKEIFLLYAHFTTGTPALPAAPRATFADYASWQNQAWSDGAFENALNYWRSQWRDFSSARIGVNDLPFAARPIVPRTRRFGKTGFSLDQPTSQKLKSLARRSKTTLYVYFLTIYASLLARHTKKDRLAVWGHFANRGRMDVWDVVGWFAHTHLLGIELDPNLSFHDLLPRVRDVVISATQHQELPVALVWRSLGGYPRDPDARVLLDVSAVDGLPLVDGLEIEYARDIELASGRFSSFGVYVTDDGSRLHILIQFSEDDFDTEKVRIFANHFYDLILDTVAS